MTEKIIRGTRKKEKKKKKGKLVTQAFSAPAFKS